METIAQSQVADLINQTNGQMFSVTFIKKNGEKRHLVGRLGVTKNINGNGSTWNPASNGSGLFVYDIQAHGYRTVFYDRVRSLVVNGTKYRVVNNDEYEKRTDWVLEQLALYDVLTPEGQAIMSRHLGRAYDELSQAGEFRQTRQYRTVQQAHSYLSRLLNESKL